VEQDQLLNVFELTVNEMQALEGADALLILTEWKIFHNPDFEGIKALMRHPYIVDGRNLYNPQALFEWGIAYQGVGRRNALCQSLSFDRPIQPVLSVSMVEDSLMAHA
jgi:UDPglucose 6-dehydrogenase